jgi:uncharacterized membrane protein
MRVNVRASLVAQTLHEVNIGVKHRGRDNVGGFVIAGPAPQWYGGIADCLYCSLILTLVWNSLKCRELES